jgi:hypothetical protein
MKKYEILYTNGKVEIVDHDTMENLVYDLESFENQEELKNEVEDPEDSSYEEESDDFEDSLDDLEFDESDLDKEDM